MRELQEKENPYASDSQSRLDFIKNKLLADNLGQSAASEAAKSNDAKSNNGDDEAKPKKGKTVTLE